MKVVCHATPNVTLDIRFKGHLREPEMFTPVVERLAVGLSLPVAIGFRTADFPHVNNHNGHALTQEHLSRGSGHFGRTSVP